MWMKGVRHSRCKLLEFEVTSQKIKVAHFVYSWDQGLKVKKSKINSNMKSHIPSDHFKKQNKTYMPDVTSLDIYTTFLV